MQNLLRVFHYLNVWQQRALVLSLVVAGIYWAYQGASKLTEERIYKAAPRDLSQARPGPVHHGAAPSALSQAQPGPSHPGAAPQTPSTPSSAPTPLPEVSRAVLAAVQNPARELIRPAQPQRQPPPKHELIREPAREPIRPAQAQRQPASKRELIAFLENLEQQQGASYREAVSRVVDKSALPVLEGIARDPSQHFRARVLSMIAAGEIGRAEAMPALESISEDESPFLRRALCLVCKAAPGGSCTRLSARVLVEDQALVVRSACLDALLSQKGKSYQNALEQALVDQRNFVRTQPLPIAFRILNALSDLKDPSSVPALCASTRAVRGVQWHEKVSQALREALAIAPGKEFNPRDACSKSSP